MQQLCKARHAHPHSTALFTRSLCSRRCRQQPASASPGSQPPAEQPQPQRSAAGFEPSLQVADLRQQVAAFMQEHVYAAEHVLEAHAADPESKWTVHPLMEQMKVRAGFCCRVYGSPRVEHLQHSEAQSQSAALHCLVMHHPASPELTSAGSCSSMLGPAFQMPGSYQGQEATQAAPTCREAELADCCVSTAEMPPAPPARLCGFPESSSPCVVVSDASLVLSGLIPL